MAVHVLKQKKHILFPNFSDEINDIDLHVHVHVHKLTRQSFKSYKYQVCSVSFLYKTNVKFYSLKGLWSNGQGKKTGPYCIGFKFDI